MAFPFVPVGFGTIAVLGLGWLLLGGSKPTVSAPTSTTKKPVTTTAPGAAVAYPPGATTPYGTSPGYTPSKDILAGEASGRTVGARYGAADRDASRANDSLNVREEPAGSADFVTGFRVGFVAGYNAEYWKAIPGKKSGAAPPTKEMVTTDWKTRGYTGGYAQGQADASLSPPSYLIDVTRVPTGYAGAPSAGPGTIAYAGWTEGYTNGYSAGFASITPTKKTMSTEEESTDEEGDTLTSGLNRQIDAYIEPAFDPNRDFPRPLDMRYARAVRVGAWGPSRGLLMADVAKLRSTSTSLAMTVHKCRAWGYLRGKADAIAGKTRDPGLAVMASDASRDASDPAFRSECLRAIFDGYLAGYTANTRTVRAAPVSPQSQYLWKRW